MGRTVLPLPHPYLCLRYDNPDVFIQWTTRHGPILLKLPDPPNGTLIQRSGDTGPAYGCTVSLAFESLNEEASPRAGSFDFSLSLVSFPVIHESSSGYMQYGYSLQSRRTHSLPRLDLYMPPFWSVSGSWASDEAVHAQHLAFSS